jgi:hypothetical protein
MEQASFNANANDESVMEAERQELGTNLPNELIPDIKPKDMEILLKEDPAVT